jgi:phosphoenolpyruvate carboxylase
MDTIKILEARQDFLTEKLSHSTDEKSFSVKELKALREATNFIKWIMNNSLDDTVQKITEKYKQESSGTMDENTREENRIEINNDRDALLLGMPNVFHENKSRNRKIQIIASGSDGVNYIQLELLKRRAATPSWKRIAYIRMTLHKFEKILKRVYAIIKTKNEEAPPGPLFYDN